MKRHASEPSQGHLTPLRHRAVLAALVLTLGVLTLLSGCLSLRQRPPRAAEPGTRLERAGDEIIVCGQLFHTGAPVVLWMDPGGYDAYRVERHFDPSETLPRSSGDPTPNRYATLRKHLPEDVETRVIAEGYDLATLQEHVDLFLYHYDVAGTSERCFEVLHDVRGLSVHFMLDVDGTIYQTLDAKERAWHAGNANDRSIGIEIANLGAYPDMDTLNRWYEVDGEGQTLLALPERMGDGGVRTPGFVARPSRPDPVKGRIQGRDLIQYDFTNEQYESLSRLTATLCKVLPRIRPEPPRDAEGRIRDSLLTPKELAAHSGLIGHYHTSASKVDPGPAFDWPRLLERTHELMRGGSR